MVLLAHASSTYQMARHRSLAVDFEQGDQKLNWINETFGLALSSGMQLAIFAVLAILLLLLLVWLFRRVFGGARAGMVRGRKSRIGVVEYSNVDDDRRLVLIRRDNVEHLVLIGGQSDLVVESGILRPVQRKSGSVVQRQNDEPVFASGQKPSNTASAAAAGAGAVVGGAIATTSNAISSTADKVADVAVATKGKAGEIASDAAEVTGSAIDTSVETVKEVLDVEPVIDASQPTVNVEPEPPKSGVLADRDKDNRGDEIQQLLDELTNDKK